MFKRFNLYRLVSLSSWVYILAYVLVIVSFALIYNSLAHEFYHPYAKYESAMREIADQVRDGLTIAFRNALTKRTALYKTVHVAPDRVILSALKPDGSHLLFPLRLELINLEKGKEWQVILPVPMKINTQAVLYKKTPLGAESFSLFPLMEAQWDAGMFETMTGFYEDSSTLRKNIENALRTIQVTREDLNRVRAFTAGHLGLPYQVPRGFSRMLYLSMVTITTLGYGDIEPLTNLTRWLTGIEATLGIILLGLFIGSVARSRGNQSVEKEDGSDDPSENRLQEHCGSYPCTNKIPKSN